jgi:hypothetical protein
MKKERKHVSTASLIEVIGKEFGRIKDPQTRSRYPIKDCLNCGVGMFYLKMSSMLQYTEISKHKKMRKNLMNLYGVSIVPSDTHFRKRLDEIDPTRLQYVFDALISKLQISKVLENFRYYEDHYLVAIDGTGYFSSDKVHCDSCCVKQHKSGKVSYYHQVLSAVMVCPGIKEVLPLAIEAIIKQDGSTKNDCERNAAIRLLTKLRKSHPNLKLIVVMDALYANGPLIKLLKDLNLRYVITGKNLDHMYDEFLYDGKLQLHETKNTHKKDTTILEQYRFANSLELNATHQDIKVNYVEYNETINTPNARKNKTKAFFSSWITDLELSKKNIETVVTIGRARWSIENETFNTLKNQGYNFEHNYGHGYKNLSIVMCYLMFIAFLIDQIQAYCGYYFRQALKLVKSKKYIWETIRAVFRFSVAESWVHVYLQVIELETG